MEWGYCAEIDCNEDLVLLYCWVLGGMTQLVKKKGKTDQFRLLFVVPYGKWRGGRRLGRSWSICWKGLTTDCIISQNWRIGVLESC